MFIFFGGLMKGSERKPGAEAYLIKSKLIKNCFYSWSNERICTEAWSLSIFDNIKTIRNKDSRLLCN